MTDTEFWEHMNSVTANTVILAVIQYFDPATMTEKWLYVSRGVFVTSPTDSLPNVGFDNVLDINVHQLVIGINVPNPTDNRLGVSSTWSIDDVVLINPFGKYDYLLGCIFDGYAVKIYVGDSAFPFSEFRQIKNLLGSHVSMKDEYSLKLQVVSLDGVFNCETQRQYITDGVSKGNPVPLAYGNIRRASPILLGINKKTNYKRYKINQYPIKSIIRVEDNGVAISSTYVVPYLSSGEFELTIEPSGVLTVDFEGTVDTDGTYINTAGKIVKHLISNKSVGVMIDPVTYADFESRNADVLGVYITQRINLNELLDSILNSVLGFKYFKSSNILYLGSFALQTSTSPIVLNKTFILDNGISMDDTLILPLANMKVGYSKNNTPSDTSALSLLDSVRQALKLEYTVYNAGIIYSEIDLVTVTATAVGTAVLNFSSASLATMTLLSNVAVGDYVSIALGVSTVNQGYFQIVNVTAASVEVQNTKAITETALSAKCTILKTSPVYAMFKNPIAADLRETFLTTEADAAAQCRRLMNIYNRIRRIYSIKITNMNVTFNILQHIRIQYERFGMANGVDGWVISTPDYPAGAEYIELRVFV